MKRRFPISRLVAAGLLVAALAVSAEGDAEQARQAGDASTSLHFRRVHVPADRVESWPRDPGVKYRPVLKDDFERLVELLRGVPPEAGSGLAVRVAEATYQARLTEEGLLVGEAALQVVRREAGQLLPAGRRPAALLPLSPCGVAIAKARWSQTGAEAVLGLDATGQLTALVEQSGRLLVDWSLRGERDGSHQLRFPLELPASPTAKLIVDLPAALVLSPSRGAVVGETPLENGARRWEIELGGHNRLTLAIEPREVAASPEPLPVLRQLLTYDFLPRASLDFSPRGSHDFSPGGLELTAQLTLDAHQEPIRRVSLVLDPGLRLLMVRQGESHVPWSLEVDPQTKGSRVVLELAEPIRESGRIRLLAVAPIEHGRPWRLPGLEVQGVFWQQGDATLLVPKPLFLEQLLLADARQSISGSLAEPRAGQSIGVQCFSKQAAIEVVVGHGRPRLQVVTGTALELSDDESTAQVVAELKLSEGEHFSLEADVPHHWVVDAVESVPPGRIKDWTIDSPRPRQRRLEVRLARALSAGTPLRLLISGHWLNTPVGEPLRMGDLAMVNFRQAASERQWMSVRTSDKYELKLRGGEELERVDPKRLEASIAGLFVEQPQGLVFEVGGRAAASSVALEPRPARYTADIQVEATATRGPLWETYRFECRPDNSHVDRLLVHFSHARDEPLRWVLVGEGAEQLTARRLPSDPRAVVQEGETWEVRLRHPRSAPFELRASRAVEAGAEEPVSLALLPDAAEQQGVLVVRGAPGPGLEIDNQRLEPVPLPAEAADRYSDARACYRYHPEQHAVATGEAAVLLRRNGRAAVGAAAIAWSAVVESRYESGGSGQHVATWRLQCQGRQPLRITLPEGAELQGVWVDDARIAVQERSGRLMVHLPAGRKFPTVTAYFATRGPRLGVLSTLEGPLVDGGVPTLAREWVVWLPPGYELSGGGRWRSLVASPPSLAERLAGPLARPRHAAQFDPLDGEHWEQLVAGPLEQQSAQAEAERFLEALGSSAPGAADEKLAWRVLVQRATDAVEGRGSRVLVDWQSLGETGVEPHAFVPSTGTETAAAKGLELLQSANLALLVHREVLVLTSAAKAASHRPQLLPLENAALQAVRSGPLAEALEEAARGGGERYVEAERWAGQLTTPWGARGSSSEAADTIGWTAYRLTGPAGTPAQVRVARTDSMEALGWALFLVLAVAGYRLSRGRPLALVVGGALLAGAALLVPAAYVPITSRAVLAGPFCLIACLVRRPDERLAVVVPASHSRRVSESAVTTAVLLLALLVAAPPAAGRDAEPAQAEPAAAKPTVQKVFVPVDQQERPTGDHYFVPETLYAELQRRAGQISREPRGWLLERGEYRLMLTWEAARQQLLPMELKAHYDLHVFDHGSRVRLPLGRDGLALVPENRVFLDGRPVEAQWEQAGRVLSFEIAEPGRYRLEITGQPGVVPSGESSGIELAIPRLPTSRLEVYMPPNAPPVEAAGARGRVSAVEMGQLVAELGPTDRLNLRWRDAVLGGALAPVVDADELFWLKVQPGSVVVHARWKLRVLEGGLRRVEIACNPRLQLVGLKANNAAVQPQVAAGNPQLVRLDLGRPVTDQVTVEASFLLTGATGVGNYRVPRLEVLGARSARRAIGISVDPGLEFTTSGENLLTPIPPADFLAQWGGTDAPPKLAYRVGGQPVAAWSLATRPTRPRKTAQQVLTLSLGDSRAEVHYEATLAALPGAVFQHRLRAPAELRVESVSVQEDGAERLARWSRDEAGSMTLFLNEAASGNQQLSLRGSLPLSVSDQEAAWPLPILRIDDADEATGEIRIYRQPGVQVGAAQLDGLEEQPQRLRALELQDRSETSPPKLGRLVSVLAPRMDAYSASLQLTPNRPRFDVLQTTTLRRESGAWQAEVSCRVHVDEGVVDVLRFEVPASWSGPYQVVPPAASRLVDVAGQRRLLVVYPPTAVRDSYSVKVRGKVATPAGSRLRVPAIVPRGAERVEHTLVLPSQVDLQPVEWETTGLNRVDLPEEHLPSAAAGPLEAFRVIDTPFEAVLLPGGRAPGAPQVHLADICLAWEPDGALHGVASFDLDPAGRLQCPLELPPGSELVQVSIAGIPAVTTKNGNHRWLIDLRSSQLPQRVDVVFTGKLGRGVPLWGGARLAAPRLGELEVARTHWTVLIPPGTQVSGAAASHRTGPLRRELVQLRAIAGVLELAGSVAGDYTDEELAAWYRPWARRWDAAAESLRLELLRRGSSNQPRSAAAELESLARQRSRAVRQLRMEQLPRQAGQPAEQPRLLWHRSVHGAQPPVHCLFQGSAAELEVERPLLQTASFAWQVAVALGIALVAAAILTLARGRSATLFYHGRHLGAIAAGLAWWLWLWPSAFGGVLIALGLVAGLRAAARRLRAGRAGVVTITTSR